MDQVKSVTTLRSGKVIKKPVIEPYEKEGELVSEGKERVEPEHCKEETDSPPALPFPHVITKQRKVNHNSLGMVSINREDKIQFIKDGLSKESLDNLLLTLETHPSGDVHRAIHDL